MNGNAQFIWFDTPIEDLSRTELLMVFHMMHAQCVESDRALRQTAIDGIDAALRALRGDEAQDATDSNA